jgi:hypothetical protein
VYGFFYQYTALSTLNYVSVYLGVIVYALVMSKFVTAHRVLDEVAVS